MTYNKFISPEIEKVISKDPKILLTDIPMLANNIQKIIKTGYFVKKPFKIKSTINNKNIFGYTCTENEIILKICNDEVRKVLKIKQNDRHNIIKSLVTMLNNENPFVIYRFDIEAFYENCNALILKDMIFHEKMLSSTTKKILMKFLSHCKKGLPRGLNISATLSELYLTQLDSKIQLYPTVLFYSRYVDDMIIVTNGEELNHSDKIIDFQKKINSKFDQYNNLTSDVKNLLAIYDQNIFLADTRRSITSNSLGKLKSEIQKILNDTNINDFDK